MNGERRLDPTLLERAQSRLAHALADLAASPQSEPLRDSVVMRFVFTYELLLQLISRYVELEHRKFTPESEMTKSKIIRRANDLGVLRVEWEGFTEYRDARNSVAHTYSEAKACAWSSWRNHSLQKLCILCTRSRREPLSSLVAAHLGLEQRHLEIVSDLLEQYVPDRPVWAFGSRTFGRARRYSDLDLAVGGGAPLRSGLRLDLIDAFDRSMLPIEVDVVDLNDVEDSFRSRIEPDFVQLKSSEQEQGGTRS